MHFFLRTLIDEMLHIDISRMTTLTFEKCLSKIDKRIPLFFILSPGVDPLKVCFLNVVKIKLKFSTKIYSI